MSFYLIEKIMDIWSSDFLILIYDVGRENFSTFKKIFF